MLLGGKLVEAGRRREACFCVDVSRSVRLCARVVVSCVRVCVCVNARACDCVCFTPSLFLGVSAREFIICSACLLANMFFCVRECVCVHVQLCSVFVKSFSDNSLIE